jgi:hypothetical protein
MGKIISCVFENCIFDIGRDKKNNITFKPNQKVIDFIKSYINDGYNFYIVSNACKDDYIALDILLKQHDIDCKDIYYCCDDINKSELIINEIKPDIYIDTHIELCAGLQFYNIDTRIYATEESCILKNKCATGIKTL